MKMKCELFTTDCVCVVLMNYFVFAWQRQESLRHFGLYGFCLVSMTREMFNGMMTMMSDLLNNGIESQMFVRCIVDDTF